MTTRLSIPETESQVKELAEQIKKEQINSKYLLKQKSTLEHEYNYFSSKLKSLLATNISTLVTDIKVDPEDVHLNSVPANRSGDYALQIPKLKQDMDNYRNNILPSVSNFLSSQSFILKTEVTGPFLNITLKPDYLVSSVISDIKQLSHLYGHNNLLNNKKVIVEYSSPNMGKSLHVGHLGTTLLGQGLANIFSATGAVVFKINHIGDWGTPCGMLEVGYNLYKDEPEISSLQNSPSKFYSAIYSKFNDALKEDPLLRDKARAAFAALENGEESSKSFWKKVRSESSAEFDRLYEQLGVNFDVYLGEAFYEPYLKQTINNLVAAGIAKEDEGAIAVDLEDANLKSVLLRKSDGATTYFARDVVALTKRKELFDYDLTLYIVGSEQTLHFRQLFEVSKRMMKENTPNCVHVPIGLISQKGAKISSRAGGALGAEELKEAIFQRAKSQVDQSLTEESETDREKIANILTRGALYYNQLLTAPGKPTDFNLDKILDMRGKSGAYLQYAAVRGKSILRKVGAPEIPIEEIPEKLFTDLDLTAISLTRLLAELPATVNSCCNQYSPHPLAHYLYDVGQAVNHFYQKVRIKDLESPLKDLYLHILEGSVVVLTNGLAMLNIEVPERM